MDVASSLPLFMGKFRVKGRVARISRALVVALLTLALAAQPALAATKSGSLTCSAAKRVWIYSYASVYVSHSWTGGGYHAFDANPYRNYQENNTYTSSTWYVIEYDFEISGWGAYCASI